MTILFVEGLTVMDFSYLHAERGLLGESWILDVMLHGTLDDQGMVLDFSDVKKAVKRLVDERYDHKLIVPIESDCSRIDGDPEEPVVTFTYGSHGETLVHTSPPSALCLLDAMAVSTDSVAKAIEADLMDIMPSNVEKIEISLHEEPIEGAFYHYSHGLRQHCGNCQRIAHGHRSRLEILRNAKGIEVVEANTLLAEALADEEARAWLWARLRPEAPQVLRADEPPNSAEEAVSIATTGLLADEVLVRHKHIVEMHLVEVVFTRQIGDGAHG